jgi:4-alpha-glucanotransferase
VTDAALRALAQAAGLLVEWHDYRGELRQVAPDTLRAVLTALGLPCSTPAQIAGSLSTVAHERAAPGPAAAPAPAVGDLAHRPRPWGATVQLYALRRPGDGGLGDFTALGELARALARQGADALALSPVHAPFVADPARFSPYMPSSRLMLNPFYVDPAWAARSLGEPAPEPGDARRRLEEAPLVDWPEAARLRLRALRELYERVAARIADDQEFRAFRLHGERALEDHVRFEALHAWQLAHGHGGDWRAWAPALRDPRSAAVEQFARAHAHELGFHVFLQWLADRALAGVQATARYAGMAIGLISDLAVGADPSGSSAWSDPQVLLRGLSLGAPPDLLNAHGQNWGLTTFSPRVLAAENGAPLREVLRAALRHAGGVRVDHILGLNRLWVIPEGAAPTQGVYLRCPLGLLLDAVAQEARLRNALVIGEDLGTVPAELPARLAAAGVLGMRVLWFMRDHGLFVEPSRWPAGAIATTTTHDLPTIAGWWEGRDIDWRARAGQYRNGEAALDRVTRGADRQVLWDAFRHAGLAQGATPAGAPAAVDAALRFVARAPAPLALFPLEDLCGLVEQPNLPGTIDEHPNWRRRLPARATQLLDMPAVAARLDAVRAERRDDSRS